MERTRRTSQPPAWTGQLPPEDFRLRLTFADRAERTAFPQAVEPFRSAPELVHSQELAEVELERWGCPAGYRVVCWLPVGYRDDLRVNGVIILGGHEWVVRAVTPRDRRGLSPVSLSHAKLRLADTAGV